MEEENSIMWGEYDAALQAFHAEEKRWNDRILKAIDNQLGRQFLDDVMEYLQESMAEGKLELVRETTGDYQEEEYNSFAGAWVDQWSVGDSGDSWNGYIYIQLKKGLWLKSFYSM